MTAVALTGFYGKTCALGPGFDEVDKYLLIGTARGGIAKGINVQNGDLGADYVVLSDEVNDNVDFDLVDVFTSNAGSEWVHNPKNSIGEDQPGLPDYLPGAAGVHQGVSWTGDWALTSPLALFDASNAALYGDLGVVTARDPKPSGTSDAVSSVSNSKFYSTGVGNGYTDSGIGASLQSSVTDDPTSMLALRNDLLALEDYLTELRPEETLQGYKGLPDFKGIEDEDIFEMNVDDYDDDDDGIAVIDIEIDGGNSDFEITNSNWIIESERDPPTFAIFRILGDSNMLMSQSTIVVGDGILGNGGVTPSSAPSNVTELRATSRTLVNSGHVSQDGPRESWSERRDSQRAWRS